MDFPPPLPDAGVEGEVLPPPLPGTGVEDDFTDNSLREEAMRDFEEAQDTNIGHVEEAGAVPTFLNPVVPAFISVGGALAAPSGAKEAPVMGATMEPGSHRELTFRITAATVAVTFLCTILGISAGAAPWFTSTTGGCTVGYGLAAWGFIPQLSSAQCSDASQLTYPRGFPELVSKSQALNDAVTPIIGPLGFAAFCISMGVIFCILSLTVSVIMTLRLLRGNAPHRFGTVFLLTAFVASSFTFYTLGGIIGTTEVLILMNRIDSSPTSGAPLAFGGVGAGDSAIVFMCAILVAIVALKIKTRAVAQTAGQENERAFYTALLGSNPKGHFCL